MAKLGRYLLTDRKSVGGMQGEVFFAQDPDLQRRVVIKQRDDVKAARREARALAACGPHPAIPPIFDFFLAEGGDGTVMAHLVMGQLEGEPLGGEDGGEKSDPEEVRSLAIELLESVAHVHASGYLHLDIKPSNLLLGGAGPRLKLIDFGGAEPVDGRGRFRGYPTGGYPPYMAPEQFEANAVLTASADLYQVANVCVFLLTGALPIEAPDPRDEDGEEDIARYYLECRRLQEAGTWQQVEDAGLRQVLAKALSLRPLDRYPSAAEFSAALRAR